MMIRLNHINKKFGDQIIFDDFSYEFNNGLYVLFGESGCGKTTLLNIICGIENFDSGAITIDDITYEKQVNWENIKSKVGYMTQDSYWIDYLTIGEQLELLGNSKEEIIECLNSFGLEELYDRYFSELSGGQKQRVFLIQFLLQKKNIILLDEPTASLDGVSKKAVFEMLNSIKENCLVICSSHDKDLIEYSNQAIYISKSINNDDALKPILQSKNEAKNEKIKTEYKNKPLFPYFIKWFTWKKRERKSLKMIVVIYVLVFLSIFVADTPKSKEENSMQQLYRINQCIVSINNAYDIIHTIENSDKNIIESVLVYNGSCPDINKNKDFIDTMFNTIPKDKEVFRFSDKILYGSYFTDRDQVIMSYEKALEYGNPEDIIGESITLKMYDGNKKFKIIGVFDKFLDHEQQYLYQSLSPETNGIFINSEYTRQFIDDSFFNWNNKKVYVLYFNSYKSMKKFVSNNLDNPQFQIMDSNVDYQIISNFEMMFYILLPSAVVVAFCALLFYLQTKKIEIMYNPHLVSLYEFLGFRKKEIERCWILGNLIENLKNIFLSGIIATFISIIANFLNNKINIFPFVLFTYNIPIILLFVILNTVLVYLICKFNFKAVSKIKWYQLFLNQRDLL